MSGTLVSAAEEDWAERCLRQCRAEAVCSLRALLQEDSSDPLPTNPNVCSRRTSPPEIIITPADMDDDRVDPRSCPTPPLLPEGYDPCDNNLLPAPKRRGHSLRHLLTRSKRSRRAEKAAAASERYIDTAPVPGSLSPESAGRGPVGRAAARAAASAAARRASQTTETSSQARPFSMSMRAPAPAVPEPDDLAIRLRAYTESGGPGRPAGATAGRRHAHSATSLSADFQRYLAARVTELRERRRHGLSDDEVRDEFLREIGGMLREMADQIRDTRLQQQREQQSQPMLPTRLVVSAAHRIGRGFQAAGGAVRHALRFLTHSGHGEQEAC